MYPNFIMLKLFCDKRNLFGRSILIPPLLWLTKVQPRVMNTMLLRSKAKRWCKCKPECLINIKKLPFWLFIRSAPTKICYEIFFLLFKLLLFCFHRQKMIKCGKNFELLYTKNPTYGSDYNTCDKVLEDQAIFHYRSTKLFRQTFFEIFLDIIS